MILYFLLGFLLGCCFLLALYLTARSEHFQQINKTESVSREKTVLLDLLHSLFDCIARGLPEEQIYQRVVSGCRLTAHGISACFFKYKENSQELVATTREGLFPLLKTRFNPKLSKAEMLAIVKQGEHFFMGEGYVGKCALDLKPRVLDAEDLDMVVVNSRLKMQVKQLLLCPVLFQKELLGIIAIVNCTQSGGFSEEVCNLLKSICEQAGIVLNNARQLQLLFEQSKVELDLTLANQVQSLLLFDPENVRIPGIDLCITYQASRKIGGDLYDVIELDDYRTAIVIGDVSGKGIPAALVMSNCLAHLRHFAISGKRPSEVLKDLNDALYGRLPEHMFVTMIYMIVDMKNNVLELARAGHEYPYVLRNKQISKLKSQGMALGLMPTEFFSLSIEDITTSFTQDDVCLLFTDGLTELRNSQEVEYSNNRLISSFLAHTEGKSAHDINHCVIKDAKNFSQKSEFDDDLTLITLRRNI